LRSWWLSGKVPSGALGAFAEVLRSYTRARGTVFRIGGGEFTVVFPDTTHDEAGRSPTGSWRRWERRTSGPAANLGVSAGVAVSPRSLGALDHLVQRGDAT